MVASVLLVLGAAYAGIPEPGLILYGSVRDDAGRLIKSGVLQWTFTPIDGGPAVTLTTSVREIAAQGGPFSYVLNVPAERAAVGSPVTGNVLAITDEGIQYRQEVSYNGNKLANGGPKTFMVSSATRGNAVRVDVGGSAGNDSFYDVNGDERMDAVDIQLVINGALGLNIGGFVSLADLNGDGFIDAVDVQLLINGVLGNASRGASPSMMLASNAGAAAAQPGASAGVSHGGDVQNKPAEAGIDKQVIPTVPPGAPLGGGIALGVLGAALALVGGVSLKRQG